MTQGAWIVTVPSPFVIAFLVFVTVVLVGALIAELATPPSPPPQTDEFEPPPRGEIP